MTTKSEEKQTKFQEMLDEKMFGERTVRTVFKEIYNMTKNDRKTSDKLLNIIIKDIEDEKNQSKVETMMPMISEYMKLRNKAIDQLSKLMDGINKIMNIASRDEMYPVEGEEDFSDDDKLNMLDDDEDEEGSSVYKFDPRNSKMTEVKIDKK